MLPTLTCIFFFPASQVNVVEKAVSWGDDGDDFGKSSGSALVRTNVNSHNGNDNG